MLVGGSQWWYFFVELEHLHCGHSNDSEKIHQVILAIRECRQIDFEILGLFLLVGGSQRWYFFVELVHCGHCNDSEKIHQVILAIRECRENDFRILGAFFVSRRS